jgi:hypothetical protein
MLTVSHNDSVATVTYSNSKTGESVSSKLPSAVYEVLRSLPTEGLTNSQLQKLLVATGISQGRATSLIERFCGTYSAFCGVNLIDASWGGPNGKTRYFTSSAEGHVQQSQKRTVSRSKELVG